MRKIPLKLREELSNDSYYKTCALRSLQGKFGACGGRIEWHHAFIFAGRQVNERWCIVPACHSHHQIANRRDIKSAFDKIILNRADDETLIKYSKSEDLVEKRRKLNECGKS